MGEDRVAQAVNQAINNALLEEQSVEGATGVLINVCGGEDMAMKEWKDVSELITQRVDPSANIIIGMTIDPALREKIRVTVIATGFRRTQAGSSGSSVQKRPAFPPAGSPETAVRRPYFPAAQPVRAVQELPEAAAEPEGVHEEVARYAAGGGKIDLNNLEIPAYLRKR
jgi:cell division protein FtsZ